MFQQIFVLLQFDPGLEYYKAAEGRPGGPGGRRNVPAIGGPPGGPGGGGVGGHHGGPLINTSMASALPLPSSHSVQQTSGPGGNVQGVLGGGPNQGQNPALALMGNPMQPQGPHQQGNQPPS